MIVVSAMWLDKFGEIQMLDDQQVHASSVSKNIQ